MGNSKNVLDIPYVVPPHRRLARPCSLWFLSFFPLSQKLYLRRLPSLPPTSRNLHKETKFEGRSSDAQPDASTTSGSDSSEPPIVSSPEAAGVASRTTILTPIAMNMFRSLDNNPSAESSGADDVQGLTQMYYLEEEAEEEAAAAAAAAPAFSTAAMGVAPAAAYATASSEGSSRGGAADANVGVGAFSSDESFSPAAVADPVPTFAEPQGLTQVFFLDPEMEAEAVAALPVVPGRSFLRERLGVSGEVVQDLRQVRWGGGFCVCSWLSDGLKQSNTVELWESEELWDE